MKVLFLLFLFSSFYPAAFAVSKQDCSCKCVVKDEDGKYGTESASGKDRESAGNNLKKALGKRKCELSPECAGSTCWPSS
jgi:hypothetical protein